MHHDLWRGAEFDSEHFNAHNSVEFVLTSLSILTIVSESRCNDGAISYTPTSIVKESLVSHGNIVVEKLKDMILGKSLTL